MELIKQYALVRELLGGKGINLGSVNRIMGGIAGMRSGREETLSQIEKSICSVAGAFSPATLDWIAERAYVLSPGDDRVLFKDYFEFALTDSGKKLESSAPMFWKEFEKESVHAQFLAQKAVGLDAMREWAYRQRQI